MSLKYQRIKQTDMALPAPIRWLTRAFSSVTLAIIWLTMVCIYGLFASVPVGLLVRGAMIVVVGGLSLLPTAWLAYAIMRQRFAFTRSMGLLARSVLALVLLAIGINLAILFGYNAYQWTLHQPWFALRQATVIYRLPMFEMTELEFYSWWPFKLILMLFVLNMIWATVRRIEFKFVNIGVLSVHTGIVILTIGAIIYGHAKLEGDTILWRDDIGGPPTQHFYDATEAALYINVANSEMMVPLPQLPRYNDYIDQPLPHPIRLHELDGWDQVVGSNVRATISHFASYATLQQHWVNADPALIATMPTPNPVIEIAAGPADAPVNPLATLVAAVPSLRVLETPGWVLEFLDTPTPERLADLIEPFTGIHGLTIAVPETDFRQTLAITPGQQFSIDANGKPVTIAVEKIGPYELSFVTPGYQGASDTRVLVDVQFDGRSFKRIIMHRYPERSQEFVPSDDPSVGPMGQRQDPSEDLHLAYIDQSKPYFRLLNPPHTQSPPHAPTQSAAQSATAPDSAKAPLAPLRLLLRMPGNPPVDAELPDARFPMGETSHGSTWLHITRRLSHAIQVETPVPAPKSTRQPKDEGTYLHALVPIDIEFDPPENTDGNTNEIASQNVGEKSEENMSRPQKNAKKTGENVGGWKRTIWLSHMRYPMYPDEVKRPKRVELPDGRSIEFAFSRTRHDLPFAARLIDFDMTPYPGSDIPRDFRSVLDVTDINARGQFAADHKTIETHLNNPAKYRGFKISQTGWDPGDPSDPNKNQRDATGRFINQQRFSILGIGNNRGIQIIALGAIIACLGVPWAFYIKPIIVQRQKRKLQQQHQQENS